MVEQVETLDRISGNRFVTRYAYHHGYFDGEEREFRGFAMVEQFDAEELAVERRSLARARGAHQDLVPHRATYRLRIRITSGLERPSASRRSM